jgi:hypothetical protein
MIANFFKKTKPIHAIFIALAFFVFYLASIIVVEQAKFSLFLLLERTIILIIFPVIFFLIRFINRKNFLSGQDSYMLLVLLLLFGLFPETMQINEIFVAHFFLLLSFRRTYSIRSLKNIKQKVFDGGFWIGVAALFYIWSALFLILVLIAIFIYKSEKIRSVIIMLVGFLTPLFLTFTYYFWNDNTFEYFQKFIFEYSFSIGIFYNSKYMIPFVFISILSFVSLVIIRVKINSLANDLKPSWPLILGHYLLSVCLIFLAPELNTVILIFVFFPVSVLTANLLQLIPFQNLREIIIYSFVLLIFGVYFL